MSQKANTPQTNGDTAGQSDAAGLAEVFKKVLLEVRAPQQKSLDGDEVAEALKAIKDLEDGLTCGDGLKFLTRR